MSDIVLQIDARGNPVATCPTGAYGQISMDGVLRMLRETNRIQPNETVTHIRIFNSGVIQYRVEMGDNK